MATNTGKFFIGTDTRLTIVGLVDEDGLALNGSANVSAKLLDPNNQVVAGAENIVFSYVANSTGNFQGNLPATLALTEKLKYTLVVVVLYNNKKMTIEIKRSAANITG